MSLLVIGLERTRYKTSVQAAQSGAVVLHFTENRFSTFFAKMGQITLPTATPEDSAFYYRVYASTSAKQMAGVNIICCPGIEGLGRGQFHAKDIPQ